MAKKELIVAGGCFWCTEAVFEVLKGVSDVESGYANAVRIKNDNVFVATRDGLEIYKIER